MLGNLNQLYLGFDDVFKSTYVKNAGMLWQPLRVSYRDNGTVNTVYLIIDHSFIGTAKDQRWFDALREVFSE